MTGFLFVAFGKKRDVGGGAVGSLKGGMLGSTGLKLDDPEAEDASLEDLLPGDELFCRLWVQVAMSG